MEKKCKGCGEPIHPKRLELVPTTMCCVKCSTTGRKGGVNITVGEGDHTYNDIIITEPGETIIEGGKIGFDDEIDEDGDIVEEDENETLDL